MKTVIVMNVSQVGEEVLKCEGLPMCGQLYETRIGCEECLRLFREVKEG